MPYRMQRNPPKVFPSVIGWTKERSIFQMEKREKKPNIFTRIGNWWKGLEPAEKNYYVGMIAGGICGVAGSAVGVRHWQNKFIEQTEHDFDASNKYFYMKGVKDGQIKAYHDLLIKPEIGMQKLGMDVKKF